MEQIISQIISAISPSALPLVVVILGGFYIYKKIGKEREETKVQRDTDSQGIHDKLLSHEFKISNLEGIVNLHKDRLESIDKQLAIVNQELVKLNLQVEHLTDALREQNEIMKESLKNKEK